MNEFVFLLLASCGILFISVGAIGVLKLPDIFCRAHALTKALTLGISLLLISPCFLFDDANVKFKFIIALLFQYSTIPIAGHILGLVAYRKNIPRFKGTTKIPSKHL